MRTFYVYIACALFVVGSVGVEDSAHEVVVQNGSRNEKHSFGCRKPFANRYGSARLHSTCTVEEEQSVARRSGSHQVAQEPLSAREFKMI